MKTCLILGDRSDIAKALVPFLERDGWHVVGWHVDKNYTPPPHTAWDLCLIPIGTVRPVGLWQDLTTSAWKEGILTNLLDPIHDLRDVWFYANKNASVCFFAGANPNETMPGYSSYATGKMGLLKACEWIDAETPEAKFFALAPGIVNTKIHKPTLDAKWHNPKLEAALAEGRSTPISKIYQCLKWCVKQPKSVVGGRNICVSDSKDWEAENELPRLLESNPSLFKLRRIEP